MLGQAWERRMGGNVLDDLRSDDLAGTAPGGEEVNDHEALLAESGVEVGLAVNHVESVFCPSRAQGWRKCGRARICSYDLRGEVVNAGRHGGGGREVAFGGVVDVEVGDVVVSAGVESSSSGGSECRCRWGQAALER